MGDNVTDFYVLFVQINSLIPLLGILGNEIILKV